MQNVTTPSGVPFAVRGGKKDEPAPTVFIFAMSNAETAENTKYCGAGQIVGENGFLSVFIDMPCHGDDVTANDAGTGLAGWPRRAETGELLPAFTKRATEVLDHLVKEKLTDPKRVAAIGTSRGAFMAFHFAAADSRVACCAGICPVTDLLALTEFGNVKNKDAIAALSLAAIADRLIDRPTWMVIGKRDYRVGTENAVDFAKKISDAAKERNKQPQVSIKLADSEGHTTPEHVHDEVAAWILSQLDAAR